MCYSAQIWADFRKYERFGGRANIKEFTKLAGWTKQKGNWVKVIPKAMRRAMIDAASGTLDVGTSELAREAEAAPGEREQSIEIVFKPQSGGDLFVACLWTYVEPAGDDPGFYTFAVITDHPPPEVAIAGHDRCIVSLREDDIEPWLTPISKSLAELQSILDRGEAVRPYFEHELAMQVE